MKLEEIVAIMQNKIAVLTEARKNAVAIGDLLKVTQIDEELIHTATSIAKMQEML